ADLPMHPRVLPTQNRHQYALHLHRCPKSPALQLRGTFYVLDRLPDGVPRDSPRSRIWSHGLLVVFAGLLVAGVLGAAMGSLSSALNSVSDSSVADVIHGFFSLDSSAP
ncbi:hypothetical protein ABZY09_47580, partial [Streptomyces sp. NPDC002928]|uniref:hypothetical protein n=1 Tax=Streptomyces sp. NPDC002928 TaxID=3154440 RepID=UPI0033BA9A99